MCGAGSFGSALLYCRNYQGCGETFLYVDGVSEGNLMRIYVDADAAL